MNERPIDQKSNVKLLNGYGRIDHGIVYQDASQKGYEKYVKIQKELHDIGEIIFKMIETLIDKPKKEVVEGTYSPLDEAEALILELKNCVSTQRKEKFLTAMATEILIIEIDKQLKELESMLAESQRLAKETEKFLKDLKDDNSWWNSSKGGPPIDEEIKVQVENLLADLSQALEIRKQFVQRAVELQKEIKTKREDLYQVQIKRAQLSITHMREGAEIGLRELQRVLDIPENEPGYLNAEARARVEECLEEGRAAQKRLDNLEAVLAKEKIDLTTYGSLEVKNKNAFLSEFKHLGIKGKVVEYADVKVYEEHEKNLTAENLKKIVSDEKEKIQDIKKTQADFKKICGQITQQDQQVQNILRTLQSYDIPKINASIQKLPPELLLTEKTREERSSNTNEDTAKQLDTENSDKTSLTNKAQGDEQSTKSSQSTSKEKDASNTTSDSSPPTTPRFGGEE